MTSRADLLIYEPSYRRLESRIREIAPDLRITLVNEQGNFTVAGTVVPLDRVQSTISWANLEIFDWPGRRDYYASLLKIGTLRWVQSAMAGVDAAVYRQIAAKGIELTTSDSQAPSIADFILAAALDYFQQQDERRRAQSERLWKRSYFRELGDTAWLIVGYGNIGRETARRAAGFNASIVGIRRHATVADDYTSEIAAMASLPQLLPQADVVVLSLGLNEATRNLANADFFARMKPGSLLINVGRGGLVDETELLGALAGDAPGRATLDVFREEPLPKDHPFWTHPKVRVTAHSSAQGSGNPRRGDELFLDNLQRYLRGEALRNVVDPADLV